MSAGESAIFVYRYKTPPLLHGVLCVRAGRFKLAMVQLAVGVDKAANVRRACQMIKEAVQNGAGMVVLPVRRGWGTAG